MSIVCESTPKKHHQNSSTEHSQRLTSPTSTGSDREDLHIIKQPKLRKGSYAIPRLQDEQFSGKKQQYKQKLCRNFHEKGYCQYKEKCCFIHNEVEPQNIIQRRTKPCRRFFSSGVCPYGVQCQYIHSEIIDQQEQREFVERTFKELKLMVPLHPNKLENGNRNDLQRFQHLYKIFGRKLNFKRDDLLVNSCKQRNAVFIRLCSSIDDLLQ